MEKFKNGDTLLVSRKFQPFKIGCYLQVLIRFFINILNVAFFRLNKICWYHHVATICNINGVLCVFEAVDKGFVNSGNIYNYIKDETLSSYLVRRPNFEFDESSVRTACLSLLGKKYDYWGTMFFQVIKQLTFGYLWLSNKHKYFEKFYCSEADAYVKHIMSNKRFFLEWFSYSPHDQFSTELLFTVKN